MYRAKQLSNQDRAEFYRELKSLLAGLLDPEAGSIANLANAAALLADQLTEINWAGFYLFSNGRLILGPFHGKPACTIIPMGKGVCGTAAKTHQTQVVPDVHQFPGHIACDAASRSEIVVPLIKGGELFAVLDIDSPVPNRFDEADTRGLEEFAEILLAGLEK